ncbi:MAG: glycosyltransferase family 2 protein [candidate division WWE3 bacterium]|nr:glycosyltransferase family 2 protein [candidate division WWE3 bacterium]
MNLSVVSYLHNNADTINELYERLEKVLAEHPTSYEIVFIDDASTDNTLQKIQALKKTDPHIKVLSFTRHYGMAAGLQAGFDAAKGDLVFTISPTLENHPEELPKFLSAMKDGDYDLIVGRRRGKLHSNKARALMAKIGNRLISAITGKRIYDITSPMRLSKKSVLKNLKIYGSHHLFLPALASLHGANFKELDIEHVATKSKNKTKHSINAPEALLEILFLKFLISATTPPFSTTPIKIFAGPGLVSLGIGLILSIELAFERLVLNHSIANRPLLLLAILMMMLGALFVVLGLLGELLIRIYFESQGKKTYTLADLP